MTLRLTRPLQQAGIKVLQGNDCMDIHPEYVSQADAVVIQRDFSANLEMYEQILSRAHAEQKPVIYEIDDQLFELPEDHIDYPTHYYSPALFAMLRTVIEADLVTTSTDSLKEYLLPFNPHIEVIPNYLDDRLWALRSPGQLSPASGDSQNPVVIGYMGTNTHQPDLVSIAPVLGRLLDHYGDRLRMRFWGTEPPEPLRSRPQVEWHAIQMHSYAEFAAYFSQQSCDIFVAPLIDSPFNHCKSSIKFLEYSALGIPGVYSHTVPYQVVRDGENGYLAGTEQEWEHHLVELIESPELRSRMGLVALKTVQSQWLLSQNAMRWATAYQSALTRAKDAQFNQLRQGYLDVFVAVANQVRGWQNHIFNQLIERDQKIKFLQDSSLAQQEQIVNLQTKATAQEAYLQHIAQSRGWKLLETARRLKRMIFR